MKLQLKNSLTLDTDQVSCSQSAKLFIDYAFFLNGSQVAPDFDSVMMRFAHALQKTIEMGSIHVDGTESGDFTVEVVPEAISALAETYPALYVREAIAKWFNACGPMHLCYLPKSDDYSDLSRVAVCWWDKRMIRPGVNRGVTAENLDERLKLLVLNRAQIDAVYAEFLDSVAKRIDCELHDARACILHSHTDWFVELTDELDNKLGEFGEGSGGTWYMTEEIMKVTHTRVLVTERDCEYCEILPGEYLTGEFSDADIFRACDRHAYGRFISHKDFILDD